MALVAGLFAPGDRLPAVRLTSRLVMPVLLLPSLDVDVPQAVERPSKRPRADIRLSQRTEPEPASIAAESPVAVPVEAPAAIGAKAPFEPVAGAADATGTAGSTDGGEGSRVGSHHGGTGTGDMPGPRRLEPGMRPPRKIKDVRPQYPSGALRDQARGTVVLEVTIGVDGRVVEATVVQSIPELDRAALDAVRQWEFVPAALDGAPIAVIVTVIVKFSIL